jgi:integrase
LHDLRRTFATVAAGIVPAYALKALLNHRSGSGDVTGG